MDEQEDVLFSEEDFAPQGAAAEQTAAPEHSAGNGDLPWLELAEKFPDFSGKGNTEEFRAAVRAGERPVEAYMRLENRRLAGELELMKKEMRLRDSTMGTAKSTAGDTGEDPFLEGLSYMR